MARPRKAATIIREPFNAEATISGEEIKQVAREAAFDRVERPMEIIKDLNEFTKSVLYHLNYMIHDFKELSPEPTDWVVSLYYPHAQSGPVYVDIPQNERQFKLCEKKAAIMEKQKRRYLVYKPNAEMTPEEAEVVL